MGKKKGAGNKLARMSEEERARYLQHRAEIEEEARRRKQQLIAIFMKVHLNAKVISNCKNAFYLLIIEQVKARGSVFPSESCQN